MLGMSLPALPVMVVVVVVVVVVVAEGVRGQASLSAQLPQSFLHPCDDDDNDDDDDDNDNNDDECTNVDDAASVGVLRLSSVP